MQKTPYSWFSDTFIIFSRTDSPEDFSQIEQASRLFFQELIMAGIPVRGAITCGLLYSQLKRNVFIGEALIDAYRYGEGQDWLGLLLCPAAVERMSEIGLSAYRRPFYREVPATGVMKAGLPGPVFAFAFNNAEVQGRNPYLAPLNDMKVQAGQEFAGKYDRTLDFLKRHHQPRDAPKSV